MQVEASSTTQSAFWQATCILVVMRCESTCEERNACKWKIGDFAMESEWKQEIIDSLGNLPSKKLVTCLVSPLWVIALRRREYVGNHELPMAVVEILGSLPMSFSGNRPLQTLRPYGRPCK